MIIDIARISSDPSKTPASDKKLISYLIRNQHWSPFQMASMCISIEGVSRAVARQVLRHSFDFQEFSQRYQDVGVMQQDMVYSKARLQHPTNRQASLETDDTDITSWWDAVQENVATLTSEWYEEALSKGIAKEVARNILPEGMVPTKMYVSGTLRSWLHYTQLRGGNGTQLEHQEIAHKVRELLQKLVPTVMGAWDESHQVG